MNWLKSFLNRTESDPPHSTGDSGGEAGSPATPEPAAPVSASADEDVLSRIAAVQALGEARDDSALTRLASDLHSEWRAVRIAAAEAMTKIMAEGGTAIAALDIGEIPEESLRRRRASAQSFGEQRILRYVEGLGSDDPMIRLAAAEVLGETGSATAASALIGVLGDPDWTVISQASESLCSLRAAAMPALMEAAANGDSKVRDSVIWCLQMLSSDVADSNVSEAASQAMPPRPQGA